MDINAKLQLALEHYQSGTLQQAEHICRKILKKHPNNVDALHFLGVICYQRGYYDLAIKSIKKALEIDPNFADAYNNLGNIFQEKKELNEAISCYRKALNINPTLAKTHYNLGIALQDTEKIDEAIICYQNALELNLNIFGLYNNLGFALEKKGKLDEAITCYQKALKLNPDFSDAYNNLGNALKEKGQLDEAIDNYQKAIDLKPDFTNAYVNLGNALKEQCKEDEAIVVYDRALLVAPNNFMARLAKCFSQIPIIYPVPGNIKICRNRYYEELTKLRDAISFEEPQYIQAAAEAVGSHQPFYLAYQGFNDRELQHIYGALVCRIMSLRYPEFADRPGMPRHLSGEPLRVGFVSGFFNLHSNWKIPIKGWIENINKQRFRLYGYYTGKKKDIATEDARKSFACFVEDVQSFEELCKTIREDNLHILIYPEVGMDPMTVRLASLRLATIQCTSWGHPDTSGLPSIDYFLSSDLMEPSGAEEHYTEKLIRLPNLSIYYTPLDFPLATVNRETLGLRQKSILYLCCQSLFKYLPQYDEIYPRIAKEIKDCQFLFISNKSSCATEQFRLRINKSFEDFGLKADDHVVFLPRLDDSRYGAINYLSDVYLDSIGWSGCNSTFEAIAHNLPILTLPGELMRGRHSAAILTMMNIQETIASSIDEYVEIAVRLGADSVWRKQISDKIARSKGCVYQDKTCITALEAFLEKVAEEGIG